MAHNNTHTTQMILFGLFSDIVTDWLMLMDLKDEIENLISLWKVWMCNFIDYILNIYSNDGPDNVEVSKVVETLVNTPGFGTRCMNGDPIP